MICDSTCLWRLHCCLLYMLFFVGCGSNGGEHQQAGEANNGGPQESDGFDTPDQALDAYGKSLVDGDSEAYRRVAAKDSKAIRGLDAIIQMETGKTPEEAAKINLQSLAPMQGFGDVPSKRFPAEITGDDATIVQVFERSIALQKVVHFRKFRFRKSGSKWHLVGSEFGEASELPDKYAWNAESAELTDSAQQRPDQSDRHDAGTDSPTDPPDGEPVAPSDTGPRPNVATVRERELFNGTDLSGWTYIPLKNSRHRTNQSWFVDKERKVLFSVGKDGNDISTTDSFRDFDLRLQWRWRPGSEVSPNGSGVVVRVDGLTARGTDPKGLEIDLRPDQDEKIGLGNGTFIAYNVSLENHRGTTNGVVDRILGWRRQPGPIVDGQWNDLQISCIEDRVTVTLNGEVVNEGWNLSAREGKITLRNQKSGIEFRNFTLTEIRPQANSRTNRDLGSPAGTATEKRDAGSSKETVKAAAYRPPPKDHPEFRDLAVGSHDCRIFFPGNPAFTEEVVKIPEGNVHVANFQGRTRRASYLFEIYTYPKPFVAETGTTALLDQTRDNLVDAPTGRLISGKSHTYQDSPALDFIYEHPETTGAGKGYCRLVMRGNRIYILEVDGVNVPPEEVAVFHDSLAPFALPGSSSPDSSPPATADVPKLPVPGQAAREKSSKLMHELYAEDFKAAKRRNEKVALARKLINRAAEVEAGEERFVLLDEAQTMAAAAGGVEECLDALAQLEVGYEVDSLQLKFDALPKLARTFLSTDDRIRVASEMLESSQLAVDADRYEMAMELLRAAAAAARKAGDATLAETASSRLAEVIQLRSKHESVQLSLETLKVDADQADANQTIGEFYCFMKGEWETGLPYLAKGADERFRLAAEQELAEPDNAPKQTELGDLWFRLSGESKGLQKKHLRRRAAHWYRLALPELTGLRKESVEKRLAGMKLKADVAGPALVHLPDVPMAGHEGVVMGSGTPFRDEPLQGKTYPQVLWAHPEDKLPSHYAFTLNRKFARMTGKAAINDMKAVDRAQRPQQFAIYGDGRLLWKSRPLQEKLESERFSLNVRSVKTLHMYVSGGGYGGQALWVDVVLEEKD